MQSKRQLAREEGFTLIELLVVVVILGLLAGIVVPKIMKRAGAARGTAAKLQIQRFAEAVQLFHLDTSRYPASGEGLGALKSSPGDANNWNGPYLDGEIPNDPWGRPYEYACPGNNGRDFEILSYGADGRPGGDGENADVTN